jgi:hypothetical protein
MKDLIRKFDDAKKRISKLKLYKDLINIGEVRQRVLIGSRPFNKSPAKSSHHPIYEGVIGTSSSSVDGRSSVAGLNGSPVRKETDEKTKINIIEEHSDEHAISSVMDKINHSSEQNTPAKSSPHKSLQGSPMRVLGEKGNSPSKLNLSPGPQLR